ncbi:MAG: LemA family protein [Candidatus Aenigmarchaeota archaeon]|nr:LemA family protein [Candidatus Aenigmarchaeota archaeon]
MAKTQSKTPMNKWIVPGIIILVILIIVGTVWGSYNSLVRLNQDVDRSWADVEAQYQRRIDLIPNLVNTVQSYAGFEKATLTQITQIRSQWQTALPNEQVQLANQFEGALSKLLLVSENYPDLKASANFISLQDSLAETENMVAVARTRYNTAVRDYNSVVKVFPSNIIAGWFSFVERDYFQAVLGAATAPKVNITIP